MKPRTENVGSLTLPMNIREFPTLKLKYSLLVVNLTGNFKKYIYFLIFVENKTTFHYETTELSRFPLYESLLKSSIIRELF